MRRFSRGGRNARNRHLVAHLPLAVLLLVTCLARPPLAYASAPPQDAQSGDHAVPHAPYLATLLLYSASDTLLDRCAGAVVAPHWVLTSARCFSPTLVARRLVPKAPRRTLVYIGLRATRDVASADHVGVSAVYALRAAERTLDLARLSPFAAADNDLAMVQLTRPAVVSDATRLVLANSRVPFSSHNVLTVPELTLVAAARGGGSRYSPPAHGAVSVAGGNTSAGGEVYAPMPRIRRAPAQAPAFAASILTGGDRPEAASPQGVTLARVKLHVVSGARCSSHDGQRAAPRHFCATAMSGAGWGPARWRGDRGGPIVRWHSGRVLLLGVVSSAATAADGRQVFTAVNVMRFRDEISALIHEHPVSVLAWARVDVS